MRRTRTAVLALLVAVAVTAPASAVPSRPAGSTEATYLGTIPGFVRGDGRYLAVWGVRDGVLRIHDSRTGPDRDVANDCFPGDGSFGRFLLHCFRPDPPHFDRYIWRPFQEPRSIPGETRNDQISGLGRYWAWGTTVHPELGPNDDGYGTTLFVDLRTGERREYPRPGGYDTVRNIDSPDLREVSPPAPRDAFWDYSGRDAAIAGPPRGRLKAYRDGVLEAVLSKRNCLRVCEPELQLEGGRVTWIERAGFGPSCAPERPESGNYTQCFRVRGYVISTGARASWLVKGVRYPDCPSGCHIHVAHTRDEVFMQVIKSTGLEEGDEVPGIWRLFSAPWPGASRR